MTSPQHKPSEKGTKIEVADNATRLVITAVMARSRRTLYSCNSNDIFPTKPTTLRPGGREGGTRWCNSLVDAIPNHEDHDVISCVVTPDDATALVTVEPRASL